MSDSTQVITITVNRDWMEFENKRQIFISSPDLQGFYLSYPDPELAYSLVEPLARALFWRNKEIGVKTQSFDATVLREKGTTMIMFQVIDDQPELDEKLEEHGNFLGRGDHEPVIFFPMELVKGELAIRPKVAIRIGDREGLSEREHKKKKTKKRLFRP